MKHKAKIAGQVRHYLTIAGAAIVAGHFADAGVVAESIGGPMDLPGLVLQGPSKATKVGAGDRGRSREGNCPGVGVEHGYDGQYVVA